MGDGVNWSEWFHFRTASDKLAPFSFVYMGDVQNGIRSLWSRIVRRAYHDAPDARLFLYAGDLINRSNQNADWGEMKGGPGWINGLVPCVPAIGNHEYQKDADENQRLSFHWRPEFTLPENGHKGLKETVCSFDYQGARIIVLSSHVRQADQVPWIEERLRNNPNRWTTVTFHHPVLSSAKGRDNKSLREMWKPAFDRYQVDLVLQGHGHAYARRASRRPPRALTRSSGAGRCTSSP